MNEFLKMDIFFFVATLSVVLITGILALVLWRIAQIMQHVEHITQNISLESDKIQTDLVSARLEIQQWTKPLKSFLNFFGIRGKHKPHNKK